MKKVLSVIVVAVMVAAIVGYSLLGVDFSKETDGVEILRVYNWEEYISESDANKIEWNDYKSGNYELAEDDEYVDFIHLFESYCKQELGRNVKVEYSTFGTNENMYNELNLSKKVVGGKTTYSYDLVCPSEYMLLKMLKEDMLEPLTSGNREDVATYDQNSSAFIRDLFKGLKIECNDGVLRTLYDYATCYCWGTMGYVYNPELVDGEAAKHWNLLWDDRYKGKSTIKDSVRDSYILALGYVFEDELNQVKSKYESGELTATEYNAALTEIYNRTDDESVKKAGEALTGLKDRLFGYEVDSGKKDMAQGKISINFAWSGDAVYIMDFAEETSGVLLEYAIPEEGSNIFFDGWAMPKGANTELARLFINFIARAESGRMNMDYIGYSSSIAGDVMFENAIDWYGTYLLVETDETDEERTLLDGKYYKEVYIGDLDDDTINAMKVAGKENYYKVNLPVYDEEENLVNVKASIETEILKSDLSYFFNTVSDGEEGYKEYLLYYQGKNRQCETQYPSYDLVTRCTVMKCFSDDELRTLNNMWDTAKVGNASLGKLLLIIATVIGVIAAIIVVNALYKKDVIKRVKSHKGLKLISSENIKKDR